MFSRRRLSFALGYDLYLRDPNDRDYFARMADPIALEHATRYTIPMELQITENRLKTFEYYAEKVKNIVKVSNGETVFCFFSS